MIWKINHAANRSGCRWSTATALGRPGISEPSLVNLRCNIVSVPATTWFWSCLRDSMRSAHCRSMRRWTLNEYVALIGSTSLPRACVRVSLPGILRSLVERSRRGLESSAQMAAQTPRVLGYRPYRDRHGGGTGRRGLEPVTPEPVIGPRICAGLIRSALQLGATGVVSLERWTPMAYIIGVARRFITVAEKRLFSAVKPEMSGTTPSGRPSLISSRGIPRKGT
jgi:hypothetical protein